MARCEVCGNDYDTPGIERATYGRLDARLAKGVLAGRA